MLKRGVRHLVSTVLGVGLWLSACGDGEHAERKPPPQPSPLEAAIARALATKLGAAPKLHCAMLAGFPLGCFATLPDGKRLAIRVRDDGKHWTWKLDGLLVSAQPIEDYVRASLDDLGAVQNVFCGVRVRHLVAGERVACSLANGGEAFVTIAADGTMALEVELDPAAAEARARDPAPGDLERASKALQHTEDDEDEDSVAQDAGARDPSTRTSPPKQ